MNGLRLAFGRKKPTLDELKVMSRRTPDADGVTRILPKELWDHPKIGDFLREIGMHPDDQRNHIATAEERIARFARSREALMHRTVQFNRENAGKYGYCHARPMLIIDPEIWDGPHGAFLYGHLDLCGYDDWNVLMCAGDQETIDRCGLVGHPGSIPALAQEMTEKIVQLNARFQQALDSLGMHVLGEPGIDGRELDRIVDDIRYELLEYVSFCKGRTAETLFRPSA
ncbi:MAG: hypothetical protein ABSG76_12635 [Xanthobacteraceae bacterium]